MNSFGFFTHNKLLRACSSKVQVIRRRLTDKDATWGLTIGCPCRVNINPYMATATPVRSATSSAPRRKTRTASPSTRIAVGLSTQLIILLATRIARPLTMRAQPGTNALRSQTRACTHQTTTLTMLCVKVVLKDNTVQQVMLRAKPAL